MKTLDWIHLEFILHYITLTNYSDHKYSQHHKCGKKNNIVNKMKTLDWNTLRIYTTLYHIYQILHCKGHMQITAITAL